MVFKNNDPNKTKTNKVTPFFYCIFSMSYTWLPIVPSLGIVTLLPLRLTLILKQFTLLFRIQRFPRPTIDQCFAEKPEAKIII